MRQQLIALAVLAAALALGYFLGKRSARQALRRAVLRKAGASGALRLAFQFADDGAMELLLPNAALKALRRGEPIEGLLQGNKNEMVFRVKSI